MRCLALADRLQAHGMGIAFFSRSLPRLIVDWLETAGFARAQLGEAAGEAAIRRAMLADTPSRNDWIIFDGYDFTAEHIEAARSAGRRVLVIDDKGHLGRYEADVVVNQNLHAQAVAYRTPAMTTLLLGTTYVLLRPEFLRASKWRARDRPLGRILVSFGGADPNNVTLQLLHSLSALGHPSSVKVIVGPANPNRRSLESFAASRERRSAGEFEIVAPVRDMTPLMRWADLAIVAAGTTVWELAHLGVPMIVVPIAENQVPVAETLSALGAGAVLRADNLSAQAGGLELVVQLLADQARRLELSRRARELVDGKGAERVARLMQGAYQLADQRTTRLRAVASADAFLLWQWANDPQVRANSFGRRLIPWSEHLAWFKQQLRAGDSRIWILECDGLPVATARYERDSASAAIVSFAVAPEARGLGFGTAILARTADRAIRALKVRRISGTVMASNPASARVFLKAGFCEGLPITSRGYACRTFVREAQGTPQAGG